MQFQYTVSTKSGEIKNGVMEAIDKQSLIDKLKAKDLLVLSVIEKKRGVGLANIEISWGRISGLDRLLFAKHLATMIKSGLSLTESLEIAIDQASSSKMKKTLKDVLASVNNGKSLSSSLSRHPKVFSPVFINMVNVGEKGGTLSENLEYLSVQLEKDYDLKRKVKGAMLYPIIVISATVILGVALAIFILPRLVKLFTSLKMELPITTRVFLAVANFLVSYGLYLLVGLIILAILIRILVKAKWSKPFFHRLYLKLPVVKKLSHQINLARFSRILGTLLKSGVPIIESLEITATTLGNSVYQRKIEEATQGVKKGKSLASTLLPQEKYFPKIVSHMISVGEKSGNLEEILFYLARFYEDEVDNATRNLSTTLEPILLIFIGVAIGFIGVAIISPIYQISGSLKR